MAPSSTEQSSAEPPVLNASDIYTQGGNFLSAVQTCVDPRTGQFNLSVSIPLGQANVLGGPTWPFNLTYNILSSQINSGFGLGWSLQYSHLTMVQDIWTLTLSSGEQFVVDLDSSNLQPGGRLAFIDLKLESMQVTLLGQYIDCIQILYKTGEIELLKRPDNTGNTYVLYEMRSPEGRALHFDWSVVNYIFWLRSVRDEERTLMTYDLSTKKLTIEPDSSDEATIEFLQNNDTLSFLLLPEISEPFEFRYEHFQVDGQTLLLPSEIVGPLGATESINWSKTPESSHSLPKDAPLSFVPRVTTWLHSDAPDPAKLLRLYAWEGRRNYLGGSSSQEFNWARGRDTLYLLMTRYEYSSTETQISGDPQTLRWIQATLALGETHTQLDTPSLLSILSPSGVISADTSITRTWDRHHLLIKEVTLTDHCETTRETVYGVDYDKHWTEQIPQCQLPHLVTVTYHDLIADRKLSEETEYEYDHFGNTLRSLLPSQVEEVNVYYPSTGESPGCPADPFGRIRFLKSKTTRPAPGCAGNAPVLSTRFEYEAIPSLIAGDPDHVVVNLEVSRDETLDQQLESTTRSYERAQGEHYGRLKTATTTLNGKSTTTSMDYQVTRSSGEAPLLWTTTKTQGFENSALTSTVSQEARSLLSGLTHRQISSAGVLTVFAYDRLGRVIRTVIADDTAYRAERTCKVHLDDEFVAQYAPRIGDTLAVTIAVEETDATGQRKRTWLDGSSRPVLVQLEDLDSASGIFRDVSTARYDAWGRETRQVSSDWTSEGTLLFELTTSTTYDGWGNVSSQTDPTGVVTHTSTDPTRRLVETWQQSASGGLTGKQITISNAAGSPVEVEVFDDKGVSARADYYTRDGLDRVIKSRTVPREGAELIHEFEYDSYSRITARMEHFWQGDEDREHLIRITRWQYAPHSDGNHPESITMELAKATIGDESKLP